MNAMQLLTGSIAQAIGWALLHLLWQATIVAGILAAVLALTPRRSATARYAAACGALALVFGMFVATAVRAYDPAAKPIATISATHTDDTLSVPLSKIPSMIVATATEGWRDRAMDVVTRARQSLPSVVALWFLGVVFLSSRLLVSFIRVQTLAHKGVRAASEEWQNVAARISESLGLRRAVRLLESAAVEVPSVLGSLRPVILIPASALTGLTPQQIEMVLAHELAHIRRHDFAINLLQAFVETLMFYHPAVWWMSSRVRIERENCCDDLAVAVCGNPIQYARALTRLEELRAGSMPMVVAANGGSLLDRIRRIAGGRAESTGMSSRWAAAVAMLSILAIALTLPSVPALAQREDKTETPQAAKATVDVVEPAISEDEDSGVDLNVDPGVDIDVDHDIDIDVNPEIDIDIDPDIDIDFDSFAPLAPLAPMPPMPAHSPRPMVAPTPMVAPMPFATPFPPTAPRAPRTPIARMAALDEMDFEHEHETDRDETTDRKIGATGKLTVDELISMRAVGVTPEYINTMRGLFPELTVRQVSGMRAVGVTPAFISEMRSAGLEVTSARAATSLAAVGVTPEYIRDMRAAGFEVKTERDATGLRAVGVTPEFVREMRSAGFEVKTARDASSLAAVGVTPQYIRDMRAAGIEIKTAREATSLRAVGVTSQFVKKLSDAGYKNLSVRELSRLAAAGVDDDFIREMEQYRDKN
ncbi:MAG TPA: M56 family metallopeptidase [Thermoanaerobaculia bacterium]|jgi:beta-lactamase regulating signal transducer with metallopeptidase domain|nr:M56 family metallopeptidase [Thermoanaerobaculia bacterium]